MFLMYAVPGAWWPVFTLRLEELNFTPMEMSWAFASSALGAVLASLVAGQVADRWVPAERCIAFCSTMAGVLLMVLAQVTSPWAVCLTSIACWLMIVPTLTLGLTVSMAHLRSPEQQFGPVRMWGTVGWVLAGWLLGYWFTDPTWLAPVRELVGEEISNVADSQRLGAMLALLLAAYALTLPHTPPAKQARSWLAPLQAAHLLRHRSFAVFVLCAFCVHITFPFSQQQTPLLLKDLGVPLRWVGPTLTIAQSMEILTLFLLPVLGWRLGMRNTLLLGLATWAAALAILTAGRPAWLVIGSQALNGFCITCYLVRGQVFINRQADPSIRASAQGLVVMINGIGLLLGNLLVGWARHEFGGQFAPTFTVGLMIATIAVVVFVFGFERERPVTPFNPIEVMPPRSVGGGTAPIVTATTPAVAVNQSARV
jgi:MFS family permease